jgi:RNA polymerase sigma factor (sigma-70 family)
MEAYVDGDDGAFQALFQRYGPILLRLTRRHLRDDELAEEIVQQTFFRLHGARNDFRHGSKLRPWVMTIAMNLVREHWRRTKRRKMTALEVESAKQNPQTQDIAPWMETSHIGPARGGRAPLVSGTPLCGGSRNCGDFRGGRTGSRTSCVRNFETIVGLGNTW